MRTAGRGVELALEVSLGELDSAGPSMLGQNRNGGGGWGIVEDSPGGRGAGGGVCSPALLTLSSGPLEASHLVVGEQHYRPPIWAVVGFCVSWGQQPAGRGCCRNYLIQP